MGAAMNKLVNIGVTAVVHFFDGSRPYNFSLMNHRHMIGNFAHGCHVMGNGEGGCAQLFDAVHNQFVDNIRHDRVKARGRFIKFERSFTAAEKEMPAAEEKMKKQKAEIIAFPAETKKSGKKSDKSAHETKAEIVLLTSK